MNDEKKDVQNTNDVPHHQNTENDQGFTFPQAKRDVLRDAQQEHIIRVNHQRPEPPVRGEKFLRWFDLLLVRLNKKIHQWVPEDLNPLAQTGAVANTSLIISMISGVLLLFWYSPSVHTAYSSVKAMDASFFPHLIRSLHRYSSDACLLFVLIHALQIVAARRFTGARWLAWVTGGVLLGLLWLDGWTGYWLVWDERAQHVALGTAKMIDYLPLLPDPLTRSFLTDAGINTLLFFVVFFIHMLIPLALGIGLWLHIARLNRPNFLTGKAMSGAVLVSLVVLSVIWPIEAAGPAKMQQMSTGFTMDWLYLAPIWLTDRLQAGLLWALCLGGSILFFTVPWWMRKRRTEPAYIIDSRCNGCTLCYQDCPYNAIEMHSRQDGRWDKVAQIDPEKCVSCGICVGACNPGAIIFPRLPVQDAKERINTWLDEILEEDDRPYIAFLCANSAGCDLEVDEETGRCPQLPGYRVLAVPCSGWVHPLMIERAVRRGAGGVLVVGCGPDPTYRTGTLWTELRLTGERKPVLREEKVSTRNVAFFRYDRSRKEEFLKEAQNFTRREKPEVKVKKEARGRLVWPAVVVVLILFSALAAFFSRINYTTPIEAKSQLVVSFKHPGELAKTEDNQKAQKEEELLPHMKGSPQPQERRRHPVRLRVTIDGKEILNKTYFPQGLYEDGNSVALEILPLEPGFHRVKVEIKDSPEDEKWDFVSEKKIEFKTRHRRVVLFNKVEGFQWN